MVEFPRFHVENLHSQVADELIRRVASGQLQGGDVLPADASLAAELGVSIGTIRRALDHLVELGVIARRKGKSTTVVDLRATRENNKLVSLVDKAGRRVAGELEQKNVRLEQPDDNALARLQLRRARPILRFDRLRSHEGRYFMVEDVFLAITTEEAALDQAGLEEVAHKLWWEREVPQAKAERISVAKADDEDARVFRIAAGEPLLLIERTLFGSRKRPLEYVVGRCNLGPDLVHVST